MLQAKYLLICYLITKHSLEVLVLNRVLIIFNIVFFGEYKPMVRTGFLILTVASYSEGLNV